MGLRVLSPALVVAVQSTARRSVRSGCVDPVLSRLRVRRPLSLFGYKKEGQSRADRGNRTKTLQYIY